MSDRIDFNGAQQRAIEFGKCPHCGSPDISYGKPVIDWEISYNLRLYGTCNKCSAPWVLLCPKCTAKFKW
jgi:formate dehydrogenase maturation protein FdhE